MKIIIFAICRFFSIYILVYLMSLFVGIINVFSSNRGVIDYEILIFHLIAVFVIVALSVFMWKKATWLSEKVLSNNMVKNEDKTISIDADALLGAGISLIGINMWAFGLPHAIILIISFIKSEQFNILSTGLLTVLLQIIIGLILTFRASGLKGLITKFRAAGH